MPCKHREGALSIYMIRQEVDWKIPSKMIDGFCVTKRERVCADQETSLSTFGDIGADVTSNILPLISPQERVELRECCQVVAPRWSLRGPM